MPRKRLPSGKRNYKNEYKKDHSSSEQIKQRSMRNEARKEKGLAKGDSREVDHKIPLSKGGGNSKKNLSVTSRKKNRSKYNK